MGDHGRALAWIARQLGLPARVYVAAGLPGSTIQAIVAEGAEVIATGRIYDDAVRMAAQSGGVLIQDTAWAGYEDVPHWIVAGYKTLFAEIDELLEPGLVVVPTGVGSLLQAALEHYRADGARPAVRAVEPVTAACVTASLTAGEPVSVDTSAPTIMAGLNCGTVSSLAWPAVRAGSTSPSPSPTTRPAPPCANCTPPAYSPGRAARPPSQGSTRRPSNRLGTSS